MNWVMCVWYGLLSRLLACFLPCLRYMHVLRVCMHGRREGWMDACMCGVHASVYVRLHACTCMSMYVVEVPHATYAMNVLYLMYVNVCHVGNIMYVTMQYKAMPCNVM